MHKSTIMSIVLMPVLALSAFATDKNHKALRVGEEGDVVVTQVLHMDGLTLQPGEYLLHHRRTGAEHFLQVQKLEVDPTPSEAYPQYIRFMKERLSAKSNQRQRSSERLI